MMEHVVGAKSSKAVKGMCWCEDGDRETDVKREDRCSGCLPYQM